MSNDFLDLLTKTLDLCASDYEEQLRQKHEHFRLNTYPNIFGEPYLTQTTTLTIKPLNDRIVCKKLEADDRTTGGIVLPDQHKGMPTRGVVVAVGPGWIDDLGTKHTLNVCVGDTILFTKHAGTTFKINGEELLVLTENEVLATIE